MTIYEWFLIDSGYTEIVNLAGSAIFENSPFAHSKRHLSAIHSLISTNNGCLQDEWGKYMTPIQRKTLYAPKPRSTIPEGLFCIFSISAKGYYREFQIKFTDSEIIINGAHFDLNDLTAIARTALE
jgi:hypothetical protein